MEQVLELVGLTVVRIVAAVIIAWLLIMAFNRIIGWVVGLALSPPVARIGSFELADARGEARFARRVETLRRFLDWMFRTTVVLAVIVYVLYLVDIDLYPIFAGAGIVGIAVAFGSQTLVRDALAGIFLIVENPYDIGDYVRLNAVEGEVIVISLRRTTLRGDDGVDHAIPNGAITQTSNYTRTSVRHAVVLRVASETPYERVVEVVNEVARMLAEAPEIGDAIVDAPSVRGIVSFRSDSYEVEVRTRVHRSARRRWPALLHRQLMRAFEEAEIQIL